MQFEKDFKHQFEQYRQLVENALDASVPLPAVPWPMEGRPCALAEAMRYSLLAGGKRLRPVLLLASFHILQENLGEALPFAAAIEMIHSYSLIHDDLPAMDNDDLRRGKPTSHKVFGEAMAILAGDALLSDAFSLMLQSRHPHAWEAMGIIAGRAGGSGMIAGQVADLAAEGQPADEAALLYIHQHKTADLFAAPILAGLQLGGADQQLMAKGQVYAVHLGLAFQITDDLLDEAGDMQKLGKSIGKDKAQGKLTWPFVYGLERAQKDAAHHCALAAQVAASMGEKGWFLREMALATLDRKK